MNILMLHPNFPGQYRNLARYFSQSGRHKVFFITKETHGNKIAGCGMCIYKVREGMKGMHPFMHFLEDAVIEGEACARAAMQLREEAHFVPDVIIGHTGWGSMLYLKDVYPNVPMIGYFEWLYHSAHSDVAWWPDEEVSLGGKMRIRTQNTPHLLNLLACDVRYTPTEWQKAQFPIEYQNGMKVMHEGINTNFFTPQDGTKLVLPTPKLDLSDAEEIISYVSRGLEPYRGFPQFMDAVRILLKRRPKLHVVIIAKDRSAYGPVPDAKDETWKTIEVKKGGYDEKRVHFTGLVPYAELLTAYRAAQVHVYLTRPFVLSWSMLEAMSAGTCLVASATPPVEEVVEDNVNGLLVNFRQPEHIALRIEEALDDAALRKRLGKAARESIVERYNMRDCLRKQVNMVYEATK